MNPDPNIPPPEVLAAIDALMNPQPRPKPKPKRPELGMFPKPEERIAFQLDRIATALENIAAIQDARAGMGGCC